MEAKASVDFLNESRSSPDEILHQAIKDRDLEIVNSILKQNGSWKATDNNGDTVLHLAFSNKERIVDEQQKIIQILKVFLDEALSINVKNKSGKTILYSAVENRLRDVIDFLVKCGADLNVRDPNGNSIVHFLVEDQFNKYSDNCNEYIFLDDRQNEFEDIDFMTFLLMKGVNVDCINNDGKTPLDLAISHNFQHVMPVLIRHMNNVTYVDEFGRTLIEVFFRKKASRHIHIMPTVMEFGQWLTASNVNKFRHEVDIVKFLLNKGVSVDHVNNEGDTLVHTFLKVYVQSQELIRWMLQRYTKINHQDRNGNTALHLVIINSSNFAWNYKKNTTDFVRMLLSKGADVNLKNLQGETAARLAVRFKQTEVFEALIRYGADLTPSGNGGNVLFELNRRRVPTIDDRTYAPIVDKLVRAGNNVNEIKKERTLLLNACTDNCPFVAQKLIENGANVSYTDTNRNSPLHIAASIIHNNQDLVKKLVKAGADINAKNNDGETPLHLASARNYTSIKTLLELGADVEASGKNGRLPLYEAIKDSNTEGIQAMLEFGANINDQGVLKEIEGIIEKKKFENIENDIYVVDKSDGAIRCLTEHWIKLKAANLSVIDGFTVYASKDNHQKFFNECLQEVETLKEHWLDGQITLYNLLQMDVRLKSVLIANKEALSKLVKSPSLANSFPNYHTLILAQYNQAFARNPLLEPAKRAWYHLTDIDLPDICVERILAHLNNEELRMMSEEEKEINYLKRPNQILSEEVAKKLKLM